MSETNSTTQTFYNSVCEFFKRYIFLEEPNKKAAVECIETFPMEFHSKSIAEDPFFEDEYLSLAALTQTAFSDSQPYRYEPQYICSVKFCLFAQNVSSWSLALKKRRLERNCRPNPFVRYDIDFINNELKHWWHMKADDKCSGIISSNPADESSTDKYSSTRSPSPCHSNSTLSSAYSSEELSTVSSASQYSCLFTSEMSSQEDTGNAEILPDKQVNVLYETSNQMTKRKASSAITYSDSMLLKECVTEQDYFEELRLNDHIERAFKYCKLFEILEQSCNRFHISPSSCGLGLPLTHLDRCWPPVNMVGSMREECPKDMRLRLPSSYGKKKKRTDHYENSEEEAGHQSADFTESFDGLSFDYPPSTSSFEQGNLYVSEMDVLSEEIWDYHISITQTEEILNMKMQLRDVLYCALSQLFPMCGLYVVGSSLNGFGTNSSDMDLCLMVSCKEINQRTDAVVVLDLVRNLFKNMGLIREQKLIIAKVPILRMKFHEPYTNIVVDLNANNSVAVRNTQLLCYYSYYDWRVRPLVSVVKEWAKRRDINDANRSSFTSYSLVLMVIHYLQCEAKILPSLQEKYPKVFNQRVDVRTLSVSLPLEQQGFCQKTFDSHDRPTLGELLLGFFEYFATKFDYANDAISIRLGQKTERRLIANQFHPFDGRISQWNCICIEEPFNYSNTAHSVHDQNIFGQIKLAFMEDYEKLEQTRDLHAFLDVNPLNNFYYSLQRSLTVNSSATLINTTDMSTISTSNSFMEIQDDAAFEDLKFETNSEDSSSVFVEDWRHVNSELVP